MMMIYVDKYDDADGGGGCGGYVDDDEGNNQIVWRQHNDGKMT